MRRSFFVRSAVLAVALFFVSTLLPGVGNLSAAIAAPAKPQLPRVSLPEHPPAALSVAERRSIPARLRLDGATGAHYTPLHFGGSPQQVLRGLREDVAKRTATSAVYRLSGGGDHILRVFAQPPGGAPRPLTGQQDPGAAGPNVQLPPTLAPDTPVSVTMPEGSYSFAVEGGTPAQAAQQDGTTTYQGVLPGVDLTYRGTVDGFKEEISLGALAAGSSPVVFDIATNGLTLQQAPGGGVDILAGGQTVGMMPAPWAVDSSVDPLNGEGAFGPVSSVLSDLGGGQYSLAVTLEPAYAQRATYPVTIDPGQFTPTANRDTWAGSDCTGCSYETDTELRAGNTTSALRYAFVNFYTGDYVRAGRIVTSADVLLWPTYVASASSPVSLRKLSGSWQDQLNWGNQPPAGTTVWDSESGGLGNWYDFPVTQLYQNVIDSNIGWVNYGLRLEGSSGANPITNNYHRFASADTQTPGAKPQLFLYYNDQPASPILSSPADGSALENQSPTLRVAALPTDPNGDATQVRFQVSNSPTDFTSSSHLKYTSPWLDQTFYSLPAGVLLDGQTYYWRAQSWDVCLAPDTMCDNKGRDFSTSQAVSSFTVALDHWGENSNWAMSSDQLGNGMELKVNEANGNAYLSYPIDSLASPAGSLAVQLTYNSQDDTDRGFGPGWGISAGPGAVQGQVPSTLLTADAGDTVKIKLGDGDLLFFSKQDSNTWAGSGVGAGTVQKNDDGTWLYTTSDGSQYGFGTNGGLTEASPATSTTGAAGFSYTYTASSVHLTSVTDPLSNVTHFNWDGTDTHLSTIITPDNRTWTLAYDASGRLYQVADPVGHGLDGNGNPIYETVTFTYNAAADLASVQDGEQTGTSNTTQIAYAIPTGMTVPRVSSVTDAGVSSPTTFDYAGPFTGQNAARTTVTDPRGVATVSPTDDYQTITDFNLGGLPIKVSGPANNYGQWPVTTLQWDTNGNLLCQRSPAANAVTPGCTATDPGTSDHLSTVYTYQTGAPYRLVSQTGPAPNVDGTGTRPTKSDQYDEGFTGLFEQKYENAHLSGVPDAEATDPTVNHDWGTGTPGGITGADYFSVRWTGILTTSTYAKTHFRLYADDGARLIVGGVTLVDCFGQPHAYADYNCAPSGGTPQDAIKQLWAGKRSIVVEYAEQTGTAKIDLQWDQGSNGTWVTIPTGNLLPNLNDLTSEVDARSTTTTYGYPVGDNRVRGLPASLALSSAGDPTRTTSYVYDDYGRTTSESGPAGTASYVFTGACLTQVTDRAGGVVNNLCDPAGDITSVAVQVPARDDQLAQTRTVGTGYDAAGRITSVTTPGNLTTKTYDRAGRLTTVIVSSLTQGTPRQTDYTYDTAGNLSQEKLPDLGGTTGRLTVAHGYDLVGNETSVSAPYASTETPHTTLQYYDAANRLVQTTDATGVVVTTDYNDNGSVNPSDPRTASFVAGVASVTATAAGVAATMKFDLLGRKTSDQVGSLNATTYTYDAAGDTTSVTDPTGITVSNAYDGFGDVTTATAPTGASGAAATTTSTYDAAGRLTQVTDANGHVRAYTYDGEGRILTAQLKGITSKAGVTDPVWSLHYDAAGERTYLQDGEGNVRTFTWDTMGRASVSKETRSDGTATVTNTYDVFSELTKSVSASGAGTTKQNFTYDVLGRRTRRYGGTSASPVDDEKYKYDSASNLTKAWPASTLAPATATVTLTYDAGQRPRTVVVAGATTTYNYDYANGGRLSSRVDPGVGTTSFGYDAYSRLSTITDPFTGTAATAYTYNAAGRELTRTDPAGLSITRGYDPAGRVASESVNNGGTQLASFGYTWDPVGNVSSATQSLPGNSESGTWSYTYDAADRLTKADPSWGSKVQYTYDANGNRNSVQKGTQTPVTTTFDTAGLPTSSSDGTTYAHDALGDLLGTPGGPTPWTYGYDTWGRTTSAANGSTSLAYGYDALDRTIVRTSGATSTTYGYAGGSQDLVNTTTSGVVTNYAWGAGGPLASSSAGLVRAYEPNLHGDASIVALVSGGTGAKGDSTGTLAYGAFGDRRVTTGQGTGLLFGFQSQPTDSDTGLVDQGTRLYDPLQGRFSTRDSLFGSPMSPLSLNQYTYGSGNPVSMVDPNGMCADPAECPPPLGASRAVADRWRSLSNSSGVRITHAYSWTPQQYTTYFNGASPAARQMMEPRRVPVPKAAAMLASFVRTLIRARMSQGSALGSLGHAIGSGLLYGYRHLNVGISFCAGICFGATFAHGKVYATVGGEGIGFQGYSIGWTSRPPEEQGTISGSFCAEYGIGGCVIGGPADGPNHFVGYSLNLGTGISAGPVKSFHVFTIPPWNK